MADQQDNRPVFLVTNGDPWSQCEIEGVFHTMTDVKAYLVDRWSGYVGKPVVSIWEGSRKMGIVSDA